MLFTHSLLSYLCLWGSRSTRCRRNYDSLDISATSLVATLEAIFDRISAEYPFLSNPRLVVLVQSMLQSQLLLTLSPRWLPGEKPLVAVVLQDIIQILCPAEENKAIVIVWPENWSPMSGITTPRGSLVTMHILGVWYSYQWLQTLSLRTFLQGRHTAGSLLRLFLS